MLGPEYFTSAVTDTAVYILLATGFMVIFSASRLLHFAHGTAFVVGAYAGVEMYGRFGVGLAIVVALAAGALFGYGCDKLIYLPLIRRGATRWILVIASLAIFQLGENTVGAIFGGDSKSPTNYSLSGVPFDTRGLNWMHWTQLILVIGTLVWVVGLQWSLNKTRTGMFIRGVASNERLAAWSGIPTKHVRSIAFLVGSAAAGFAGLLSYLDLSAEPTMGLVGSLHAIIPFIIGGMNSVRGIVAASVVLGFGGVLVVRFEGAQWSDVILFVALALVLFARPQGLQVRQD